MEIIKANGDILKLSVSEYIELFMEKKEEKPVIVKSKPSKPSKPSKLVYKKGKDRMPAKIAVEKIINYVNARKKEVPFGKLVKMFKISQGGSSSKIIGILKDTKNINVTKINKRIYLKSTINVDLRIERGKFITTRAKELMEQENKDRIKAYSIASEEWERKKIE